MKKYLIEDYKNKDKDHKPSIKVVTEHELFEILQNRPDGIAVMEIGECIIDWS